MEPTIPHCTLHIIYYRLGRGVMPSETQISKHGGNNTNSSFCIVEARVTNSFWRPVFLTFACTSRASDCIFRTANRPPRSPSPARQPRGNRRQNNQRHSLLRQATTSRSHSRSSLRKIRGAQSPQDAMYKVKVKVNASRGLQNAALHDLCGSCNANETQTKRVLVSYSPQE